MENAREAWAWSIEHGRLALPSAASRSLGWYFEVGGLLHEGIELLEELIRALRVRAEEALAFARVEGDEWFGVYFLLNLGYVAGLRGCPEEAYEKMRAAMEVWRKCGDPHSLSMCLNFITPTLLQLRRYEEAEAGLRESIALCEQTGNRWGTGTAYRLLGAVKLAEGDAAAARPLLRKSLEVFGDFFIGWDIARTLTYLGDATLRLGDVDEARKTYVD